MRNWGSIVCILSSLLGPGRGFQRSGGFCLGSSGRSQAGCSMPASASRVAVRFSAPCLVLCSKFGTMRYGDFPFFGWHFNLV